MNTNSNMLNEPQFTFTYCCKCEELKDCITHEKLRDKYMCIECFEGFLTFLQKVIKTMDQQNDN